MTPLHALKRSLAGTLAFVIALTPTGAAAASQRATGRVIPGVAPLRAPLQGPPAARLDADGLRAAAPEASMEAEHAAAANPALAAQYPGDAATQAAHQEAVDMALQSRTAKLLSLVFGKRAGFIGDMMDGSKAEAVVPGMLYSDGRVPLDYMAKAMRHDLHPAQRERIEALAALVRVALRPAGSMTPEEVRSTLSGHRGMGTVLQELGLDGAAGIEALTEIAVVDPHLIDQDNVIPPVVLARVHALGLFRLKFPKEAGGLGLHQREYAEILKVLPQISGALAGLISAHNTIGSAPLAEFGTPEQKAKILPRIAQGRGSVGFALTEPGAGTDLKKLATTAVLHTDKKTGKQAWRLKGEKIFITGTPNASMIYVVTGHTIVEGVDLGPSVIMVDLPFNIDQNMTEKKAEIAKLDKKGLRITPFLGEDGYRIMTIRGSGQSRLQFDDFEAPVAKDGIHTLLGYPGKGKTVPLVSLNRGRAGFGPSIAAAATFISELSMQWAMDRLAFDMYGGRLADMEKVHTTIGENSTDAAALRAVSDLTSAILDDQPKAGVAGLSAAIKASVASKNWKIAIDGLDMFGGHGLFEGGPFGIERAFRDAKIATIVEGHDNAMKQLPHLMAGIAAMKKLFYTATIAGNPVPVFPRPINMTAYLLKQAAARMRWTRDDGGIDADKARQIQWFAARFSMRFGFAAMVTTITGPLTGRPFAVRQNLMIHAFEAFMDILKLSAVELRLAHEGDKLSERERSALAWAATILRRTIPESLRKISPREDPVERLRRLAGKEQVRLAGAEKGSRPDRFKQQMDWLEEKSTAYHGGEFRGNQEDPSGADFTLPEKIRFQPPTHMKWYNRPLVWLAHRAARMMLEGRGKVSVIDFPDADRDRLLGAVNKKTAAFLAPVHPAFGWDWLIDAQVARAASPSMVHWAAHEVVNSAKWLWLRMGLISNKGGEAAKAYSVHMAREGHGVLLHPDGTVNWWGSKFQPISGAEKMAYETARQEGAAGKPVYLVSPVWRFFYVGDVRKELDREMRFIERAMYPTALKSGEGLPLERRFAAIQEQLLARNLEKYGLEAGTGGYFDRQEHAQRQLLARLAAKYGARDDHPTVAARKYSRALDGLMKKAKAAGDEKAAQAYHEDRKLADAAIRLGKFAREVYGTETLTQEQIGESVKRLRQDLLAFRKKRPGFFRQKLDFVKDVLEKQLPVPAGPVKVVGRIPEPIRVKADGTMTQEQYFEEMRKRTQDTLDRIGRENAAEQARYASPNPFL